MSAPRVVAVAPASPAEQAGVLVGDEFTSINGVIPRDILEYRWLVDEGEVQIDVRRDGIELQFDIEKLPGEAFGAEVHSAVFDQVVTCDNHCEFCFIYQLPPGLRSSLYLKDDDYRLSFLYGNFTTLTRFTEADLERVLDEGLSPLHVSIHATDRAARVDLLRNRRGGMSLRWLRALLDHGVQVHGQVVVCPGLNDGEMLDDTLAGVLDEFPELVSVCIVPLGISRYNREARMRAHSQSEALAVVAAVQDWQDVFLRVLGRRLVHAADEYYLLADVAFPPPAHYEGFGMHEDGVGMARTFEQEFTGASSEVTPVQPGFFSWVDGAPADGYRAPRTDGVAVQLRPRPTAPVGVLTGSYGATVLAPLIADVGRDDVRIVTVDNQFFGGNTGVAGLMVGADIARVLAKEPAGHRYLLPDVCLSRGLFLDGTSPLDLPHPVEIIPTDGAALRSALTTAVA